MESRSFWRNTCLAATLCISQLASAMPMLVDPGAGTLSLVADSPTRLPRIDGLAFDAYGNLFGALETANSNGGIVYIDKHSGAVTDLDIGTVTGADQLKFAPDGTLYVTNELTPAQPGNRLFQAQIQYGAGNIPVGATVTSVTTSLALNNPEGLAILQQDDPGFGPAGTLYVGEDLSNGEIHRIGISGSNGTSTRLV